MKRKLTILAMSIVLLFCTMQSGAAEWNGPWPDTGQTKCYDGSVEISCPSLGESFYGQDAQYQGLTRSYTKLGLGGAELPDDALHIDEGGPWIMTRDNVTGLVWELKTSANRNDKYTWSDAQNVFAAALNNSNFGGFNDWRVPTVKELISLVDASTYEPALDKDRFPKTGFSVNLSGFMSEYWTSTSDAADTTKYGWTINFNIGRTSSSFYKTNSYYVRAVRGGKAASFASLIDNGDGTVTDPNTGLMWQKSPPTTRYYWNQALSYTENMTLAGHTDWRLPNRNELLSLVDYSRRNLAINPILSDPDKSNYWSSTTSTRDTNCAWHVRFIEGSIYALGKTSAVSYVRAVRTAQQSGSFGSLAITINPQDAIDYGALWRRKGTEKWLNSQYQEPVPNGSYTIEFKPIYGWITPADIDVKISEGSHISVTKSYVKAVEGSVQLTVSVYSSETGNPLAGASVTVGEQSGITSEKGSFSFSDLPTGFYRIEISKTDFAGYREDIDLTQPGTARFSSGLTPATSEEKNIPKVLDVTSTVSNRNREAYFLDGVSIDSTMFTASVNWNGGAPKEVRFITPKGTFTETATGNRVSHLFNMGSDFGAGGRLQVVAVSEEGAESEAFDANITVMPIPIGLPGAPLTPTYKKDRFSYGGELSIGLPVLGEKPLPSDVPFFEGFPLVFNAAAKASVIVGSDGSTSYNFSRPDGSKIELGGISFEKGWSYGGRVLSRYDKSNNIWQLDGGSLTAGVSIKKELGPTYTLVPVGPITAPIYLSGEISAEADLDVGVTGFTDGKGWQFDGTAKPSLGGKAISGIGGAKVLAVEGALGARGSFQLGWPKEPTFREAGIGLSGSISVVTLFYTYERPLWEYSWVWPEKKNPQDLVAPLETADLRDLQSLDWHPIARTYSGGGPGLKSPLALPAEEEQGLHASIVTLPGQTDIYPQSTPALIRNGDKLMALWITDDLTKSDNNRTSLLYALYDGTSWSTPSKVAEDKTADFYPALASITGGALAAWQNTGAVMGEDADISQVAAQQEIALCRYDNASGSWGTALNLTSNDFLDRAPEIAGADDKAIVVWVASEENNMLGSSSSPNTLMASFFDGENWTSPDMVGTFAGAVLKSVLVYDGETALYLFSGDKDGDISTDKDQELYKTTFDGTEWSAIEAITQDELQDANPQLARDSNQDLLLLWYRAGAFMMARNFDMVNCQTVMTRKSSSGAADFRLISGENGQLFLIWPDASSRGQDLYLTGYDPTLDIWGLESQITDTDFMERSLAGVQAADGSLALLFNRVAMVTETRQLALGDETVEIEVPLSGTVDLCMATVPVEGDISVDGEDMTFAPETLVPGEIMTIGATVTNNGLKAAQNISVDFYYGDPAGDGVLIGSGQTIAGPLAAGDTSTASVEWTIPDAVDPEKAIYVLVDAGMTVEDNNRTNNSAHRFIFKADLEIAYLGWQALGPVKRAVTVSIVNGGAVAAGNIPVVLRKSDLSGSTLFEENLQALSPGESADLVFEWDMRGEDISEGYHVAVASVNLEHAIEESSYMNNSRTIQVLGAMPEGTPQNPSIAYGAEDVTTRPLLAWDAVTGATSYDLYIWKDGEQQPNEPMVGGLANTYYQVVGDLLALTSYRWQVVAKNESGSSAGEKWLFSTGEVPDWAIITEANPEKGGKLEGGGIFEEGEQVVLTATVNDGYRLVNWTEDGAEVSTNSQYSFQAQSDRHLVANFVKFYTLIYRAEEKGRINGINTQQVDHGKSGTEVEAVPDLGFRFAGWSDGSVENPRTDRNVTENIAATAAFEYSYGDVSLDGNVDTGDAVLLLRYTAGMVQLSDLQKKLGNVTAHENDNDLGLGDAMRILMVLTGGEFVLP